MTNLKNIYTTKILPYIQNPAKYIGNEINSIVKDHNNVLVKMALAFPDSYEVGMSHLGTKILYSIVNQNPDFLCERVFSPWTDMEERLKKLDIPLCSMETYSPLFDFDIVGFSLQHELCYTNLLNILNLGKIPLLATKRSNDNSPIIIAGGPVTLNPEPLTDFIDAFFIGDSEESLVEFLNLFKAAKQMPDFSKKDFLLSAAKTIKSLYVPTLYRLEHNTENQITNITKANEAIPTKIRKREYDINKVTKINYIVPFAKIIHDRVVLEIMRGCPGGCRFCQAGMIYRPVREKSLANCLTQATQLLAATGYEEISLSSLSSTDYSQINELIDTLFKQFKDTKTAISLPSLRADKLPESILQAISDFKKTGLTIAPEAGSQRLRDYINKKISEEDILQTASFAYKNGWRLIKVYFMVGLPSETTADIDEMIKLIYAIANEKNKLGKGKGNVNVTISFFVPKPHTPFQWERVISKEKMYEIKEYIYNHITGKNIKLKFHNYKTSYLESFFAKGDRSLGKVILNAYQKGCKFDDWKEFFKFETWEESFKEAGIDMETYLNKYTNTSEILPWDHIDTGIKKEFLLHELAQAEKNITSPGCLPNCKKCGIC